MSNKYTVTAFAGLALPPGTPVKLSDGQLALRAHQVAPADGRGFVVSDQELTFKRGETIVLKGELPRGLAVLTDVPPAPAADPTPAPGQADEGDGEADEGGQ
jgi:hypothetical protein